MPSDILELHERVRETVFERLADRSSSSYSMRVDVAVTNYLLLKILEELEKNL